MLRHYDLDYGYFENWMVYLASGYGAGAMEVDEDRQRVPRSPVWIDIFEEEVNK